MKKILFLLLILFIKLNAYEYLIYENLNGTVPTYARYQFYTDINGNLQIKRENISGDIIYQNKTNAWYNIFNNIRLGQSNYINSNTFIDYYKSDLLFLNDLYLQSLNIFLNFLYNFNNFSSTNYIEYNNYELLYNENGLAVESIVNGKWAGLYEDSGQSGYLYNEKGDLLYINGEPPSFLEKINEKLLKRFKINLESIFIKNIFYPLLVLIFACVIFRSVIRMAFKAFLIRFYDKKIAQLEKRRENIENA